MAGGEEFVIDVIAKWKDEASGGAGKLDKALSSLKKDADSYGKTIDSLGKKMSALKGKQSTLSGALQKAQSQYSSAKKNMDAYGNETTTLQGKLKSLQSEHKSVSSEIRTLEGKIKSATSQGKAGESQVTSLTEALQANQKKQEDLASSITNTSNQLKNAKQQYKSYRSEVKSSSSELTNLQRQEQQAAEELKKTTAQRTRLQQASLQERYQNAQNTYAASTAQVNKPSAAISVGSALQKAGGTINKIGNGLTLGVTTPLIAAGTAAVKTGIDFENALSQAAGAMDLPMSQMGKMKQLALEMGQETVFSATEAAQAITELAKGGLSEANISGGALKSTMDLAASSGMGMADAANVIVQVMGAFELSADKSNQAVNALAGAAAASSADVTDLSQALSQSSAAAHNAGWSVQDTTAVLAAFADAGIQGSDAGTSLKTMLQRLSAPTDTAAKEMKALGIQVRDSKGNMKDATSIAQELQDKLKNLSSSQRDSALNDIFGSDAMRAATVLMNDGAAGLQKYTKATNDQTAASRMADSQMGSTGRAIENMKGSIETAAITIEGALAPTVTDVANKITELVNAFTNLPASTQKAIIGLGGVAIAAGPVLKVVGGLTTGIGKITSFFGKLGGKGAKVASAATGAASTASTVAQASSGGASTVSTVADAASSTAAMATGTSKVAKATQAARKEGEAFSTTLSRIAPLSQSASAAVGPYSEKLSKIEKTFKDTDKASESFVDKLKKIPTMNTSMDEEAAAMAKAEANAAKSAKTMGTATKATSKFSNISSKLPGILGGVATAVGAVTVALIAYHKQAVSKNLDAHFGDVKLSADEVEDSVKRLTTNDWTLKIDAVVDGEQKIKDLENSLEETKQNVAKYQWQVSVGMKLTPDEMSDFKSQLNTYADQVKSYIKQQHYTADLAIKADLDPKSSIFNGANSFTSTYYNGLEGEMTKLGDNLAKLVNDAFSDNVLTDSEMSNIDKALETIQKREEQIEKARNQVKLSQLKSTALGSGLTEESFQDVVKGISDANTEMESNIQQSVAEQLVAYQDELNQGKISQSQYDSIAKKFNAEATMKQASNVLENSSYGYNTIYDKYKSDINQTASSGRKAMSTDVSNLAPTGYQNLKSVLEQSAETAASQFQVQDWNARGAISQLAKDMSASTQQLKAGAKSWLDQGKAVPENYVKGLEQAFELEMAGGDKTNALMYQGIAAGKSGDGIKAIESWRKAGLDIPDEFIQGVEMGSGKVYDATTGIFKDAQESIQMNAQQLGQMFSQMGLKSTDAVAKAIQDKGKDVENAISDIMSGISAQSLDATGIASLFSGFGITLETGLTASLANVKPDIQAKVAGLLATLFEGIQLDTSSLSTVFSGLGVTLKDGVAQALSGLGADVQQAILNAVTSSNPAAAIAQLQQSFEQQLNSAGLKFDVDATGNVTISKVNVVNGEQAKQDATEAAKQATGDGATVTSTVNENQTVNVTKNLGTVTDNTGGAASGSSSSSSSTQTVTVVPQLGDTSQLQSQLSSLTGTAKVNATLGDVSQAQAALNNLNATAKVTAQADITAAVTALNDVAKDRNAKIIAIADVATAKSALDSLCVPRTVTITATLNSGSVAAEINALARDRSMNITVNKVAGTDTSGTTSHAAGGIVKGKTLSWLAEEGWPEAVIPFDPARRKRAIGLWEQTGEKLGVTPSKHAAGGIVGGGQIIPLNPSAVPATPEVEPAQTSSSGPSITIGDGAIQITIQASGSDADALASAINSKDLVDMIANALADKVETVMTNTTNVKGA